MSRSRHHRSRSWASRPSAATPALRLLLSRIAELESQVDACRGALAALAGAPPSPIPGHPDSVLGGLPSDELFAFDDATDGLCEEDGEFVRVIRDVLREAGQ